MIEIVTIGDELLQGTTVNTNGAFLSRQLFKQGYAVCRQTTLSDEPDSLKRGLGEIFHRAAMVIVTGGLGPTCDDCTRQVVADLFDTPLVYNEQVAGDLQHRFGDQLTSLQDQATLPQKAAPLLNPLGTAPGLVLKVDQKIWILLPGVPQEMQVIFSQLALPLLQREYPVSNRLEVIQLYLHSRNENQLDPVLRALKRQYPEVEMGIYPGYGVLGISFRSSQSSALSACCAHIQENFREYLYSAPGGTLEEAIHHEFIQAGKTLVLAESCTGGRKSAQLTRLSGASKYLLGSWVTYSNELKTDLLGVPAALFTQHGAVSQEVVTAMWEGAMARTTADFAIAVSGIAGPDGGTEQKPVGTIWAAVGMRDHPPEVGHFVTPGNRETCMLAATNRLLGALYRQIALGLPAFAS